MAKSAKYVCYFCGERRRSSKGEPPAGKCPKSGEYETHLWLDDKHVHRWYREQWRNRKTSEPLSAGQMCYLGNYYVDSHNMEKATKWFLKAARAGDKGAMLAIGNAYAERHGIAQNAEEAAAWYRKAADAGNKAAKRALFQMFEAGIGEATEWVYKEADAGNITVVLALAHAYEDGNGVPQDKAKAMELYRSVAEAVTVAPAFMIGGCFGGAMWDGFIFDVITQTVENSTYGMTQRGYAYEHGLFGVAQDKKESMKWYQKAADAGDSYAMFALGNAYSSGEDQDEEQALMWYRKAADAGMELATKHSWTWEALRASRAMTETTLGTGKT